jgi:tRNA(fMet)-specific endonuclease VapC
MATLSFLLDTNIVSETARSAPNDGVMAQLRRHEAEIALAAPVLHELRFGWLRLPEGRRRDAIGAHLQQVLTVLPVLAYDETAARVHAELRAQRESLGKPLPFVDGQIAAIAVAHGLTLVTRNLKDFQGLPGLRVVNWFKK